MKELRMTFPSDELLVSAVNAIENGDLRALQSILDQNPELITARGVYASSRPTLLHFVTGMPLGGQAAPERNGELAQLLIRRGADIEAPARPGQKCETPLVWAVNRNALDVLAELLKAGAQVDVLDSSNRYWTPLTDAVYFGEERMQKRLIEAGARVTLRLAAGLGDLERVKSFFNENGNLSSAADFPCRNASCQQMLDEALLFAARKGKCEISRWLLSHGANVNARRDVIGAEVTALHQAVAGDRADMLELLLQHGADPTIRDSLHNSTPLEWAEHQEKPHLCRIFQTQSTNLSDAP